MFKNQYQPNRQMFKEYAVKVLCRGYFIRSGILVAVAFVTFIVGLHSARVIAWLEAICGVIIIISMVFMPEAVTRRLLTQETDVNGLAICTITFADVITVTRPASQSSVEYGLITKLYELKSCYVIRVNSSDYLVKKGCFVEGDENLFESFLLHQCPQIDKIKKL